MVSPIRISMSTLESATSSQTYLKHTPDIAHLNFYNAISTKLRSISHFYDLHSSTNNKEKPSPISQWESILQNLFSPFLWHKAIRAPTIYSRNISHWETLMNENSVPLVLYPYKIGLYISNSVTEVLEELRYRWIYLSHLVVMPLSGGALRSSSKMSTKSLMY